MKTFSLVFLTLTAISLANGEIPGLDTSTPTRENAPIVSVPNAVAASDRQFLASQSVGTPDPVAVAPEGYPSRSQPQIRPPASRSEPSSSGTTGSQTSQRSVVGTEKNAVAKSRSESRKREASVSMLDVDRVEPDRRITDQSHAATRSRAFEGQIGAPDVAADDSRVVRYARPETVDREDSGRDDEDFRVFGSNRIRIERAYPAEGEVHVSRRPLHRFFHRLFTND